MPVPSNLGMGEEKASRLASQAAYLIQTKGHTGAALRYYLSVRSPGATEAQLTWAIRVGRRTATAVGRAQSVGSKATFGGLFRGNAGLSPGYTVVVRVSATLPGGNTVSGTYLVPNVVNSDTVQSAVETARSMAARNWTTGVSGSQGRLYARAQRAEDMGAVTWETEIVGIVASAGAT